MNPFDLPGPDFLRVYVVVLVTVMIAAGWLRWFLRLPGGDPPLDTTDLSPYEIAYLAGGERLTVSAALARLMHEEALALDTSHLNLKATPRAKAAVTSPVEAAILAAVMRGAGCQNSIATVRKEAAPALGPVRERLEDLGLLVGDRAPIARFVPVALVLLVVLLGAIKIVVGIIRSRPVGFLVALCLFSVMAAFLYFMGRVHRSRRGDRALAQLRTTNSALRYQATSRLDQLAGDDVVLALGLFGIGLLAGSRLADLFSVLRPSSASSSGSPTCGDYGGGCSTGGGCGGGVGGSGCGGCSS